TKWRTWRKKKATTPRYCWNGGKPPYAGGPIKSEACTKTISSWPPEPTNSIERLRLPGCEHQSHPCEQRGYKFPWCGHRNARAVSEWSVKRSPIPVAWWQSYAERYGCPTAYECPPP